MPPSSLRSLIVDARNARLRFNHGGSPKAPQLSNRPQSSRCAMLAITALGSSFNDRREGRKLLQQCAEGTGLMTTVGST